MSADSFSPEMIGGAGEELNQVGTECAGGCLYLVSGSTAIADSRTVFEGDTDGSSRAQGSQVSVQCG